MATIVAVNMGYALEHANLGSIPLMLGFITMSGIVGLLIVVFARRYDKQPGVGKVIATMLP